MCFVKGAVVAIKTGPAVVFLHELSQQQQSFQREITVHPSSSPAPTRCVEIVHVATHGHAARAMSRRQKYEARNTNTAARFHSISPAIHPTRIVAERRGLRVRCFGAITYIFPAPGPSPVESRVYRQSSDSDKCRRGRRQNADEARRSRNSACETSASCDAHAARAQQTKTCARR